MKLDHREHLAAVEWEFCKGIHAIEMSANYFMKQPLEVVFGFYKFPATIQWPSTESIDKFEDVTATWRTRDDTGIQHPDSQTVRLRQGYKEGTFALESSSMPLMMLTVVASAPEGVGGIKDRRRLQLVDYAERDGLDKHCCFRVKKITEHQLRLEACCEKNTFVMIKMTSDPRVTAPFIHMNSYDTSATFKMCTTFCVLKTRKEVPKYILNKHNIVEENRQHLMKAANSAKSERVSFVECSPQGLDSLGVCWRPNVGKVRNCFNYR